MNALPTQDFLELSRSPNNQHLEKNAFFAYRLLHSLFALLPLIAGIDKFFNVIKNWPELLSPLVPALTHIPAHEFMLGIGASEIFIGLTVALRPRLGALLSASMFLGIMINLLTMPNQLHLACLNLSLFICSLALFSLAPRAPKERK